MCGVIYLKILSTYLPHHVLLRFIDKRLYNSPEINKHYEEVDKKGNQKNHKLSRVCGYIINIHFHSPNVLI